MTLQQRWRIGFDIGGTFTDFILYDGEKRSVQLHKRLTTPHDPSEAALIGLEELVAMAASTLADVSEIVHGTTLVTNAVIERKGARLGLITTGGFRDMLEIGTEQRYDIYDLFLEFPEPLVAARPAARGRRAHRPRRQRRHRARPGSDARARCAASPRTAARRSRSASSTPIATPSTSAPSAASPREEFPELSISLSSDVVAEIVGIPALRHHLRQRLCAAADGRAICGACNANWRRAASRATCA